MERQSERRGPSTAARERALLETRRAVLQRALYEMGWEDAEERVADWDGEDLDFLRGELGPEEFQTLLDELADEDRPR